MCDLRQDDPSVLNHLYIPNLKVKWGSKIYEIQDLYYNTTVRGLKEKIYDKLGIKPDRQKLLNLCKGKLPDNNKKIGELGLKPGFTLIVMGSREDDILRLIQRMSDSDKATHDNDDSPKPTEDYDALSDPDRAKLRGIKNPVDYEIYLTKIQQKMANNKLKELNKINPNKKLLVIGINDGVISLRPNRVEMHTFLYRAYHYYNIAIWSSSISESVQRAILNLVDNQRYKIALYLDQNSMITMYEPYHGPIRIKPLDILWMQYPMYSPQNTIIIEDKWLNVFINAKSALIVRKIAHDGSIESDVTFARLGEYLLIIAEVDDFRTLNHRNWEQYRYQVSKRRFFDNVGPVPDEREMCQFLKGSYRVETYNLNLDYHKNTNVNTKQLRLETNDTFYNKIEKQLEHECIREMRRKERNKKLLILDLDHTLFNPDNGMPRPYLHEFLARVYKHYNIGIWSASTRSWTYEMLDLLNVLITKIYKIAFYMDVAAMFAVNIPMSTVPINVKPLGLIWRKFPSFSSKNTIIIDDNRIHFLMNPQSGLEVAPFNETTGRVDYELQLLSIYLEQIASVDDFRTLNHKNWKNYRVQLIKK